MSLQQRVALVTGGGRGIGAATARLLAARGNRVVINYVRNEAAAEGVVAEIREAGGEALALRADVGDPVQVASLVSQVVSAYGRLDILVSNAPASATLKPLQHLSWEEFFHPVEQELRAAFELTRAVAPSMIQQGYGRIVYTASGLAKQPGMPGSSGIGTAKAALVTFAKYVAQELGPHGIIANTIAPGMVETELSGAMPAEAKQRMAAMTPLRRVAQPEDIAQLIVYLASEENSFVTGIYTPVNGGMMME